MNQYLANKRGNTLEFDDNDFIRLGRRSYAARDNEDELIIAGGLGKETQQEQVYIGSSNPLAFNKNDFIRSGRGRRTTGDNKDNLIIAGGLGKETQQEQDNKRGGVRLHLLALFGQYSEDDRFIAPTQGTQGIQDNNNKDTSDSKL